MSKFSEIEKAGELSWTDGHLGWSSGSWWNLPDDPEQRGCSGNRRGVLHLTQFFTLMMAVTRRLDKQKYKAQAWAAQWSTSSGCVIKHLSICSTAIPEPTLTLPSPSHSVHISIQQSRLKESGQELRTCSLNSIYYCTVGRRAVLFLGRWLVMATAE